MLDHEAQGSPHAAQLARGFARLQFEPVLEADFRAAYQARISVRNRLAVFAGALFFALFAIRDILTLPNEVWQWTAGIRLLVIVPATLFLFFQLERLSTDPRQQFGLAVGAMLGLYGLLAAVLISRVLGHALPYEGLLLVLFFVYFMLGLRLRLAALVCVPLVPIYMVLSCWLGETAKVALLQGFYLLTANVIGVIGLYLAEHLARENWLNGEISRFRAEHDPLTLVYNRRALMTHLRRLLAQSRRQREPLAVLMVDVDHFKQFNDVYGHIAGDECLVRVARALAEKLRRPMDMLGRFGGEEFLAIAYGVSAADLPRLAELLRTGIADLRIPHADSAVALHLTVSIGAAHTLPEDNETESALLERADSALYDAKQEGRNTVRVSAAFGDAAGHS